MSAMKHAEDTPRHCRQLLTELLEYLDGELTPARCRQLERHLSDCDCCGALAVSTKNAILLCRETGKLPLPESVRQRARRRAAALLAKLDIGDNVRRKAKPVASGPRTPKAPSAKASRRSRA